MMGHEVGVLVVAVVCNFTFLLTESFFDVSPPRRLNCVIVDLRLVAMFIPLIALQTPPRLVILTTHVISVLIAVVHAPFIEEKEEKFCGMKMTMN